MEKNQYQSQDLIAMIPVDLAEQVKREESLHRTTQKNGSDINYFLNQNTYARGHVPVDIRHVPLRILENLSAEQDEDPYREVRVFGSEDTEDHEELASDDEDFLPDYLERYRGYIADVLSAVQQDEVPMSDVFYAPAATSFSANVKHSEDYKKYYRKPNSTRGKNTKTNGNFNKPWPR